MRPSKTSIPSVADASLSLIPGESQFSVMPSLASEILIRQRIPAAPLEKVKDDYAEKLLRYKDVIEVDYSSNYIQSDALINVFQDASGLSFVHYVIEPRRLTFEETNSRYRADVAINGQDQRSERPDGLPVRPVLPPRLR